MKRASGALAMFTAAATALAIGASCDSGDGSGDGDTGDTGDSDGDGTPGIDAGPGGPDAGGNPGGPDAGGPGPSDDLGQPGPHAVYEKDGMAGTVAVTVWAPSGDGGATILAGKHALVVVSPGFQLGRGQYESMARHLASHGLVVVGQDFGGGFSADHMAFAEQTLDVVDWALGSAGGGLGASVDPLKIGLAGHSMGGKVSMLAASLDARVGAVVGWDPVDALPPGGAGGVSVTPERMGAIAGAVAVLGETLDGAGGFMPCAPTADNYHAYYQSAKSPALEVTIVGGDHMDWVDDPSCFSCGFCMKGAAADVAVKLLTARTTTAWMKKHLDGDDGVDTYLTGAVMQADVTGGKVTLLSK